jgi:hypothetical protein
MTTNRVELAHIELPDFGAAETEPQIQPEEYAARLAALRTLAAEAGLDVVVVYADREHCANLAFLTNYDPRFEEALLIVPLDDRPIILVGNEGKDYVANSPLDLDVRLYQPFSLMGQDRSRSQSLSDVLSSARIGSGVRVGIVDWKYFTHEAGPNPESWINAPSYIVDTLRNLTGRPVVNITRFLMNPDNGLRSINTVDQLAMFEFAATAVSNTIRRALRHLQPGARELDVIQSAGLSGLPSQVYPILLSGPRTALALASPSMRQMQHGDPISCAIAAWGALSSRAGFLVHDESELPAHIRDYADRLVKPYFAAVAEWYATIEVGIPGGELYRIIHKHLGDPFFGVGLNPGHLIHIDEWVHSPIFDGSTIELKSGMAVQVDVIPATHSPYFMSNIEDGIALADESLRRDFAARWPEAWSRIQARRAFMENSLGIRLKPDVLPFSNLAAHLTPYLLSPNLALRLA